MYSYIHYETHTYSRLNNQEPTPLLLLLLLYSNHLCQPDPSPHPHPRFHPLSCYLHLPPHHQPLCSSASSNVAMRWNNPPNNSPNDGIGGQGGQQLVVNMIGGHGPLCRKGVAGVGRPNWWYYISDGHDGAAMLIWPFLAFAYFAGWDRDIRTKIVLEKYKVM